MRRPKNRGQVLHCHIAQHDDEPPRRPLAEIFAAAPRPVAPASRSWLLAAGDRRAPWLSLLDGQQALATGRCCTANMTPSLRLPRRRSGKRVPGFLTCRCVPVCERNSVRPHGPLAGGRSAARGGGRSRALPGGSPPPVREAGSRFPDVPLSARRPVEQCWATRAAGRRALSGARLPAEPGFARREREAGQGSGMELVGLEPTTSWVR